jgi:hypothetical protein
MRVKRLGLLVLITVCAIIVVVATLFRMEVLIEYVFAPLLEFVLRLFTSVGR